MTEKEYIIAKRTNTVKFVGALLSILYLGWYFWPREK